MTASFRDRIAARDFGIVTYGMTPPKIDTAADKLPALAETQASRLRGLDVDAVVVYDIHDEKDRTPNTSRPFPFAATWDGLDWARDHLGGESGVRHPFIHFRCIAKYEPDTFAAQMTRVAESSTDAVVIVGGASSTQQLAVTMPEAYACRAKLIPQVPVGAVMIPERHTKKGDEHERMAAKQSEGVSFFITQCVYNLEEAKNVLSDYYHHCRKTNTPMVPVMVTLTPCGSAKTLEFLAWLGVKVSHWLTNDLLTTKREGGILEESVDALLHMFTELVTYAARKGIPIGCNVESVAIRKAEIEASVRLVSEVRRILDAARPEYESALQAGDETAASAEGTAVLATA
jgi:5,10-methylenetetrahydrofolate reductase